MGRGGGVTDRVCRKRDRCRLCINVGKEIGSAALIAEGHHARVDGLASLAVFVGAVGVYSVSRLLIRLSASSSPLSFCVSRGAPARGVYLVIDGIDPTIPDEVRDAGVAHQRCQGRYPSARSVDRPPASC